MIGLQNDLLTALANRKGEKLGDDWYKYQPTERMDRKKGCVWQVAANRKKGRESGCGCVFQRNCAKKDFGIKRARNLRASTNIKEK
jgi:hypothetical protein